MAPAFIIFVIINMVNAHGYAVDSLSQYRQCDSDHQCDEGFFCYEESHYCTRCLECKVYKRKSSWRLCSKTPSDCGICIDGYVEEILHEGKSRDMCIPSTLNPLSHINVPENSTRRLLWATSVIGLVTGLFLPILYFVFCRRNHIADRRTMHHGIRQEEPPPYRSIELTTLSTNNSEETLHEDDHVMRVGQQKDCLVQAVPFQKPAYLETELLTFDNNQEDINEDVQFPSDDRIVLAVPTIDFQDENTMPSDWTPVEDGNNGQLMGFELADVSASDDTCEPANKRYKTGHPQEAEESNNTQLNINLIINNNVTINKSS